MSNSGTCASPQPAGEADDSSIVLVHDSDPALHERRVVARLKPLGLGVDHARTRERPDFRAHRRSRAAHVRDRSRHAVIVSRTVAIRHPRSRGPFAPEVHSTCRNAAGACPPAVLAGVGLPLALRHPRESCPSVSPPHRRGCSCCADRAGRGETRRCAIERRRTAANAGCRRLVASRRGAAQAARGAGTGDRGSDEAARRHEQARRREPAAAHGPRAERLRHPGFSSG